MIAIPITSRLAGCHPIMVRFLPAGEANDTGEDEWHPVELKSSTTLEARELVFVEALYIVWLFVATGPRC